MAVPLTVTDDREQYRAKAVNFSEEPRSEPQLLGSHKQDCWKALHPRNAYSSDFLS